MKKQQKSFAFRASVMAVQGALITLAMAPMAFAEDVTKADLTNPTSTVEIGLTGTSAGSYKFGEYNGLENKAVTVNADIDLRGGSAYDSSGVTRYRLLGKNLGLDNRSLQGEFGEQGKFRINFGLDELRRNASDSYMTPYQGAGSNNLTLPRTWVTPLQLNVNPNATTPVVATAINTRALDPAFIANDGVYRFNNAANAAAAGAPSAIWAPSAAQTAAMLAVAAADTALYQNFNVFTTRKKADAGFMFNIDTRWDVRASVRRENKDGTQLRSSVSRSAQGDAATVMPIVINQTTDQFDLSLNFKDDVSFMNLAYYGSIFKNKDDVMTWEAWQTGAPTAAMIAKGIGPFQTNVISTGAPTNEFHQFNLTGGYDFSKATKLVANASYARNTQNQPYEFREGTADELSPVFLPGSNAVNAPPGSANARVDTTSLNLKLTHKPVKDLNLTAMYKYNDRDNKTAVHVYAYDDAGEGAPAAKSVWAGAGTGIYALPATLTALNINANRPYSKKTHDINLDADYNLGNAQAIKVGYDYQKTDRHCNGTWVECSDAPKATENKLRLEWRGNLTEDFTARAGYARSQRKTEYNEYAWLALVPMANYINSAAVAAGVNQSLYQTMMSTGFNGWGPLAGYPVNAAGVAQTTLAAQQALLVAKGLSAQAALNQAYYWLNNNVVAAQTGYGNVNVIYDPAGFKRYYAATRDQDRLRGTLNWQATDQLSLGAGLDYTKDNYPASVYGLQKEQSTALNLEAGYMASDDLNFGVYYSNDERKQANASNSRAANATTANVAGFTAIVPDGGCVNSAGVVTNTIALRSADFKLNSCDNWGYDRKDKTDTLGLNVKQKQLAGGKLDLVGDAIFARSRSDNSTWGGTWVNNPAAVANAPAGTVAAFFIPATPMPTVTTDTVTLKLSGSYKLNKTSAIKLGYSYNYLKVVDYTYNDKQIVGGGLSGVLPTNEKVPSYTVHTIGASYVYSF